MRRVFRTGRDYGFSLMEVLAACAIIGILSAIAIPVYNSQKTRAYAAAAADDANKTATQMMEKFATMSLWGTSPSISGSMSGTTLTVTITNTGGTPSSTSFTVPVTADTTWIAGTTPTTASPFTWCLTLKNNTRWAKVTSDTNMTTSADPLSCP